jgi:type IV fimbrial biogenesis protein FimT
MRQTGRRSGLIDPDLRHDGCQYVCFRCLAFGMAPRSASTAHRKKIRQLFDLRQNPADERSLFSDGRLFKSTSIWIKIVPHPVIPAGHICTCAQRCVTADRSHRLDHVDRLQGYQQGSTSDVVRCSQCLAHSSHTGAIYPSMNTTRTLRKRSAGFSLMELLVVVAIIAVLSVIAVPSYKSITAQDRMASELSDLNGDIELARSAAIKQGVTVTICASNTAGISPPATNPVCSTSAAGWNAGWIVFTDVNGANGLSNQVYAAATGDTLLRLHAPLQGKDTAALTFNRMGGTGNAGTLSLHDVNKTAAWTRCLVVSEVGLAALNTSAVGPAPGTCP